MKRRIAKCGIMSFEQFKEKTLRIAKGEYKPGKNEPKIWFESIKAMAQVLSKENMTLLRIIDETKPDTLTELAFSAGRNQSSLSQTLKKMEKYGIVELKKEKQHIKPIVKATDFHIEFGISRL